MIEHKDQFVSNKKPSEGGPFSFSSSGAQQIGIPCSSVGIELMEYNTLR